MISIYSSYIASRALLEGTVYTSTPELGYLDRDNAVVQHSEDAAHEI